MTMQLNPETGEYTPVIRLGWPELFDAITGAGALEVYPWYVSHKFSLTCGDRTGYGSGNRCAVVMDTGETTPAGATLLARKVLTPAHLRRTIVKMLLDDHPLVTTVDWGDPYCDTDVDADIADCIMQTAILGEVVFG